MTTNASTATSPQSRFSLLSALCFLTAGCSVNIFQNPRFPEHQASAPRSDLRAPIVLVHGYKGSALTTVDGDRRYPTLPQVLGFGEFDLSLDRTWYGPRQSRADGLVTAGLLQSIVLLPGVAETTLYGPFVQAARDRGRSVYAFSYDWRRDNLENVARLELFVREVSAAHNDTPVDLVAHSLGGLISWALIKDDPRSVGRLVLAGAPLVGGVGALIELQGGGDIGLNREALAPHVVATFASLFGLFPLSNNHAVDEHGELLPINFYHRSDWQRWRLGAYAHGPSASLNRHLDHALPLAQRFRELTERQQPNCPPILVVHGRAHPTFVTAIFRDSVWDLQSAAKEPGDGRILWQDTIPVGYSYDEIETTREHADLLSDPNVIDGILD